MRYFSELLTNWRSLAAGAIGLGSGFSFTTYTASIMGPHLIEDFGWSRSQFASVTSLTIILIVLFPIVGRLTDIIGVRRTALIGVVTLPVTFVGYSAMNGDFWIYVMLFLAQAIFCITTTATVYTRIVIQYIEKSRGLALAVVASAPAFAFATVGPLLNNFVETGGWRAGYLALAVFTGVLGAAALFMMPPEKKGVNLAPKSQLRSTKQDYAEVFRMNSFWIMLTALLLCNLHLVIGMTQLNLVLLENGVSTADASIMISLFSTGMLVGRFICGFALDRFPAHIVSAAALGAPSIGLFFLASSFDSPIAIGLSILLIGLSFGAEGDIIGYMVARNFGVRIYSSVMGMMTAATSAASSSGAALLSLTLGLTDSFALFLSISGFSALAGSLLFLLLKGPAAQADVVGEKAPAAVMPAAD